MNLKNIKQKIFPLFKTSSIIKHENAPDISSDEKSQQPHQVNSNSSQIDTHFISIEDISLNKKVNDYLQWNTENMIKGKYTNIGEYRIPIELRNFIEKMAIWYELRYPDYEINRLIPGSSQEELDINNIMFENNSYITGFLEENPNIRKLDWTKLYNFQAFINSLPWKERFRFQDAKYRKYVYVDKNNPSFNNVYLQLASNGTVIHAEGFDIYTNYKITNKQLKGIHVKQVVKLLNDKGILLPIDNELEETINNVDNWLIQKEGLLDAVMYRIIERGGSRIGPRRGYLFAKEFKRNIDIPMQYAIDRTDPGLRSFINEYILAGGSKELICYVGYFSKTECTRKLETISIQDLILTQNNNAATFYTTEETELHQKLINILNSQIDLAELKKEQVKKLRLQRKIASSKKTPK